MRDGKKHRRLPQKGIKQKKCIRSRYDCTFIHHSYSILKLNFDKFHETYLKRRVKYVIFIKIIFNTRNLRINLRAYLIQYHILSTDFVRTLYIYIHTYTYVCTYPYTYIHKCQNKLSQVPVTTICQDFINNYICLLKTPPLKLS